LAARILIFSKNLPNILASRNLNLSEDFYYFFFKNISSSRSFLIRVEDDKKSRQIFKDVVIGVSSTSYLLHDCYPPAHHFLSPYVFLYPYHTSAWEDKENAF
jgi:hypothetical protein